MSYTPGANAAVTEARIKAANAIVSNARVEAARIINEANERAQGLYEQLIRERYHPVTRSRA